MATHSSKTTTNHDEIRKWAEERGGKPSAVKGTGEGEDVGVLRIDFPGFRGENRLEEISWEEFFAKFDENELALVYQDETASGEKSYFSKLVKRENTKKKAA
jgi:hypothetical protein